MPTPKEGEERALSDVLKFGAKKDTADAMGGLKWMDKAIKYGEMYGVDPYLICAVISSESKGNEKDKSGGYWGLMQLSVEEGNEGTKVTAYNHKEGRLETETLNPGKYLDPDYNIKLGTMKLAHNFSISKGNVLLSVQGYNNGIYGAKFIMLYYLSGGTLSGIPSNNTPTKEQNKAFEAYSSTNHTGWVTALYNGDLAEEKVDRNGHGYLDPNDGKHDACTWYASHRAGQAYYLKETAEYYAGDGMPWMMKEDGTVVTVDGGSASGYAGGNSSAIGAFNSYLASNWQTILEKKELLYPWTKELDVLLENDRKGDFKNAKAGDLPVKSNSLFIPNLTKADEEIVLNMMFALNQGNYLSKYDYMGEAEWKAMYNQLLSSPTGKTWDDKWIGFTCEEVFGKSLEDLGTLFKEGSGINPTISRTFGKLKNIYSGDDINVLSQYNETNFGIDLSIPNDTEVLALENGEIIAVSKKDDVLGRYGNFVQIKFNNNVKMVVANLKTIDKKIKVGKTVSKGDVLGTTGGNCKSYKEGDLHIELLYKNEFINPEWIITRDMNGFDDPIEGNVGTGGVICGPNDTGNIATGGVGADYVETAKKQVGKPYVSGGTGPDGFDCSGLVQWSMAQHEIHISRTSRQQRKDTARITLDQLQPGDLIFRHGKYGSPKDTSNPDNVTHVMIYIGNNQYVHAPEPGRNVEIRNFKEEPGFSYGRFSGASNVSASNSSVSSSSGVCQTHNQTILNGGMPIPLNLQTDSRWADKPYGAGNPKGNTIHNNGCAPTSISMVASYLTGKTIIPPDVTSWAGLKYYSSGAGSTWNIFGASAKHWGYNSKQISKTPQEVMKELNAGHPIIASMGPGAFTNGGHFIVLRGITADGQILVNDPFSKERSEKSWSMSIIMNQSKAMWSFWK